MMRLSDARQVLALKSLEEIDAAGNVISWDRRAEATKETLSREGSPDVANRAQLLTKPERIGHIVQQIASGESHPGRTSKLALATAGLAGLLGLATHVFGHEKLVNLLSMPMLGLMVWNLIVYALILVAFVRHKPEIAHRPSTWLGRWGLRLAGAPADVVADGPVQTEAQPTTPAAIVSAARGRFWGLWLRVIKRRAVLLTEGLFHLGALSLALGMVAGMYIRGLALEYTAAWESTFLNAGQVSQVLNIALGPAATLRGEVIPDATGMAKLNVHAQETLEAAHREKAARWMHYYALSTLIVIILPRLGLAGMAWLGLKRLERRAPFDPELTSWTATVRRDAAGAGQVIAALSFGHELPPRRRDAARGLLHRLWPSAGHVDFRSPTPYGEEDEMLAALSDLPSRIAILMNFSATPESEVHGAILRTLHQRTQAGPDGERGFVLLLDAAPFRERFGNLPEGERRLKERRASWEKLVESVMSAAYSEEDGFMIWRRMA